MTDTKRGLNRDTIKYIAMFTMLLNHISTIFMPSNDPLAVFFRNIGYFTAISMCYFLVEGIKYTRSQKDYGKRLFIFALISQIPFSIAFTSSGIIGHTPLNMFFTLFICFCVVKTLQGDNSKISKTFTILGLVFLSLFCDWPFMAPIYTMLFVWAGGNKTKIKLSFAVCTVLFGSFVYSNNVLRGVAGNALIYSVIFGMLGTLCSAIVISFFYNGKRMENWQNFSKWFFYLFYPVHLMVLGGIRLILM